MSKIRILFYLLKDMVIKLIEVGIFIVDTHNIALFHVKPKTSFPMLARSQVFL